MDSFANLNISRVKSNPVSFLIDLGVSLFASLSCMLIVRYRLSAIPDFDHCLLLWLFFSLVSSLAGILATGVNRIIFTHASFIAVYRVLSFVLIKSVLLMLLARLTHFNPEWNTTSAAVAICDFFCTVLIYYLFKLVVILHHHYVNNTIEASIQRADVLIYGTGPKSLGEALSIIDSPDFNFLGFITRDGDMAHKFLLDRPVFLITSNNMLPVQGVSVIMFTEEEDRKRESDGIVKYACDTGIMVVTVPSAKMNYSGLGSIELNRILGNHYIADNLSPLGRAAKRLIDITLSFILIIAASPVFLTIFILLAVSEGKPVLFRQERIGRFGKPFTILKFRTMKLDAEAHGPALYAGDNDPRLTRIGKFLRVHHLDELPQLFNIFAGDMSFVGYRPERKVFITEIVKHDPRYAYLYQMRPGVTSYATLKNGYTDTMEKMLRRLKYDLYYMSHRSLLFDAKIIIDTSISVLSGKRF